MTENKSRITTSGIADYLAQETHINPSGATNTMFDIANDVCEGNMVELNNMLEIVDSLRDGEQIAKIAKKTPEQCRPYAEMLFDLFMLPIILHQLQKDGCVIAQKISPDNLPKNIKASISSTWKEMQERKEEIKGLHQFQTATDNKSAYGRLILALAEIVLQELDSRS